MAQLGQYATLGDTFLENLQGLTTLKIYQSDGFKQAEMDTQAERFRKITMKVLTMQLNSITIMDLIAYGGAALGAVMAVMQLQSGRVDLAGCLLILLLSADFFLPMRQLDSFFHIAMNGMAAANTVILTFDLAMLFTAAALYRAGAVSFGGALLSTVALMSSFGPCVALANLGSTLQSTFAAGNRVLDILDETPVVGEITGQEPVDFAGAEAENVTFSYGAETVLDSVSVEVPEHQIVGIVGRSGSGKSTLLKLFMRFWAVQKGAVQLSGVDVGRINTANLRELESFVAQDTHLFHDSIRNNLRVAKLDATDEEIIAACKKASIHDFIMTLPQDYDTPVGELGDTLSGGERQRLGLAQAFLHGVPLMLLDEPTSSLDSLNEAVILRSLKEEREEHTVVLVSHRQSTMRIADQVYSVESGRMS